MGGAVPPLSQYAFMVWCSVRGSTGDNPKLSEIVFVNNISYKLPTKLMLIM